MVVDVCGMEVVEKLVEVGKRREVVEVTALNVKEELGNEGTLVVEGVR